MIKLSTAWILAGALAAACGTPEPPPAPPPRLFVHPAGFLWGVATAAQQIEGGLTKNDWSQWEKAGRAPAAGRAADFYHRYKEDVANAAALHLKAFRLSIEWSRVEPAAGVWDQVEIDHYRDVLRAIRGAGMEPVVTLVHYTLPIWVQSVDQSVPSLGGWRSPATAAAFAEYAGRMAAEYGDLVDLWITHNEPVVSILAGFLLGAFPPGEFGIFSIVKTAKPVMRNMLAAHAAAYRAIHAADRIDTDGDGAPALVSIAHNVAYFDPADPDNAGDVAAADQVDHLYNRSFLDAALYGKYALGLDDPTEIHDDWKGTLDYLGVNYYSRTNVVQSTLLPGLKGIPCFDQLIGAIPSLAEALGCPPYGRDHYEGMRLVLEKTWNEYHLPILITENGMVGRDGAERAAYISRIFGRISAATANGVDVFGYLFWTLLDQYEYVEGYDVPMGLYSVDYADPALPRALRPGTEGYRDLIDRNPRP